MTVAVWAETRGPQQRLHRERDRRVFTYEPHDVTRHAVLLGDRRSGMRGAGRETVLAGIVDDGRRKVRIVSIVRMHQGPEQRRDERRHERNSDKGPRAPGEMTD